jgi:hypothetical protein
VSEAAKFKHLLFGKKPYARKLLAASLFVITRVYMFLILRLFAKYAGDDFDPMEQKF